MKTDLKINTSYSIKIDFTDEDNFLQFIKQLSLGLRENFREDDSYILFNKLYEIFEDERLYDKYDKLTKKLR